MVNKMAMKVAECLINNGIINESDKVIYQFGAESFKMKFCSKKLVFHILQNHY